MLRPALLFLAVLCVASAAPAAERSYPLKLDVQVGWGEALRPGRWTPIFITTSDPAASDAKPHALQLDLQMSQPQPGILTNSGTVVVGPRPTTFLLYAPPREEGYDELVVTLRDAESGRMLAHWPEGPSRERRWARPSVSNRIVIGVLGEEATRLEMLGEATSNRVAFVTLKASQLPDRAIGLDMLDVLILARVDLGRLGHDRQVAIVEWVRAGGCLLVWPSDEHGGASPIAEALPCRVGDIRTVPLSAEQRKQIGLTDEIQSLTVHELRPRNATTQPGALSSPLKTALFADALGDQPSIFSQRLGFGRITVSPVDPAELHFTTVDSGRAFYQTLTPGLGVFEPPPPASETVSFGADNVVRRKDHASQAIDSILSRNEWGRKPSMAPEAWVVLGLAFLIGPLDWLTLRMTGRRGMTLTTICGWLALLGAVGMLAMDRRQADPLQMQTFELIDQADGQVISRQLYARVTSGTDQRIRLQQSNLQEPDALRSITGFWELPSTSDWTGRGRRFDVGFKQLLDGSAPLAVRVRPDATLRMRGDLPPMDSRPLIQADLKTESNSVHGTVTNLSAHLMSDVRIRIGPQFAGAAASPAKSWEGAEADWQTLAAAPIAIPRLSPGESIRIDLPLQTPAAASPAAEPMPESALWAVVTDLSARRSWRIDVEGVSGDTATIYAKYDGPGPDAIGEAGQQAVVKRQSVLRAIVPLQR